MFAKKHTTSQKEEQEPPGTGKCPFGKGDLLLYLEDHPI